MHIREVAPTELACCMRSCVRPVRLIQSWLRRKRARSQRCSFESPSVAYDSPEHCQSTKHGSTSNRTTSQKIKVRVYPITCPLCKGLVTNERMGVTADVRVRNMGTISCSTSWTSFGLLCHKDPPLAADAVAARGGTWRLPTDLEPPRDPTGCSV